MSSENQQEQTKPPLLASNELYRFCDEFDLVVELEKPFEELDGFIIKIIDEEGNELKKEVVHEMSEYETVAGTILNKLSQNYPKR